MGVSEMHSIYDIKQDYEWNYHHVPQPDLGAPVNMQQIHGCWTYACLPVSSPLAVAAGPLLNSRWIEYYAKRGFDILTYKTVRRCERSSYQLPNLVPVKTAAIQNPGSTIPESSSMEGSWAVSFGMPSRAPEVWREDVAKAKQALRKGQILSVSVVATPEEGDDLKTISDDYAICANWAFESGADVVEVNFSCPNVSTRDWMLFMQADASQEVLSRIRDLIDDKPLLVKLGYVNDVDLARHWVKISEGLVQGLVMVNCIGAKVATLGGKEWFDGAPRGIAGTAIAGTVRSQLELFQSHIREQRSSLKTIAVGGITRSEDVAAYLEGGVEAIQVATAAMLDPFWAVKVRTALSGSNDLL